MNLKSTRMLLLAMGVYCVSAATSVAQTSHSDSITFASLAVTFLDVDRGSFWGRLNLHKNELELFDSIPPHPGPEVHYFVETIFANKDSISLRFVRPGDTLVFTGHHLVRSSFSFRPAFSGFGEVFDVHRQLFRGYLFYWCFLLLH